MRVLQPKQKDTPGPRDTRCAGHENYEFEQLLCNLQKMQEADQRREGEVQPSSCSRDLFLLLPRRMDGQCLGRSAQSGGVQADMI